jgi:hypothetical protein
MSHISTECRSICCRQLTVNISLQTQNRTHYNTPFCDIMQSNGRSSTTRRCWQLVSRGQKTSTLQDYTVSQPSNPESELPPPWKPPVSNEEHIKFRECLLHSIRKWLYFRLLSPYMDIHICKSVILPVVLGMFGHATWKNINWMYLRTEGSVESLGLARSNIRIWKTE